ncbi:MAG TPA: 50S ribosomal protein L23 [Thermoanaerobaculia bacterium]|nr:50S ribosomal protein L23 [Thermoanaerobaculia bacterium]
MRIEEVIVRPLITEKIASQGESQVMAFEVNLRANKIQVKKALETKFPGVKVADVRVARMHGKTRRVGRFVGRRSDWKKVYVRLAADSKQLQFFEGV